MPENDKNNNEGRAGLIRSLGDALGALFMMLLAIGFIAVGVWFIAMTAVDLLRDNDWISAGTHIMATLGCILAFQILMDKSHEWATIGFLVKKDKDDEDDDE